MTATAARLDPITADVIRYALVGTADEMKLTLMRSAYNPIIYEVLDFSCGVFDRRGRLAAQSAGLSIFLGTLDWAVGAVLDKFGQDGVEPGDIFVTNDPYGGGGTHLNDVCLVAPAFFEGELIGFSGSRAHWTDIGGAVPLSVQTDARELHAEGLVLPTVRLYRRGQANEDLLAILRANIRDSVRGFGDLRAQIAAGNNGILRLVELAGRFGATTLLDAIERFQDGTEAAVRSRLETLPDFVAVGEDFLDDDGVSGPPTRIRVRVEKRRGRLSLDFAGSDPANPSGYNMSLCSLVSACRVIFKAVFDPETPANDGSFRCLDVVAPPGTVVSATYPSAVSLYGEPARRAIDAVWKALAQLFPEAIPAGHYGTIAGIAMAGLDDRFLPPRYVTYQGPNLGGWGASATADGESALCCITNGDTRNTPAELIEYVAPLRVRALRLREGSGGAGRHRGGLGIEYDYEVLTGGPFAITCALGRTEFAPFGAVGGGDGSRSVVEVWRDGELAAALTRATAYPLRRGDRVVVKTGGGGGYGPAADRDPQLVALDELRGYLRRGNFERLSARAAGLHSPEKEEWYGYDAR